MFNIQDNKQENIKVSERLLKYSKSLYDQLLTITDTTNNDFIAPEFSKVMTQTVPDNNGNYVTRQYYYYYSRDSNSEIRLSINENETFDLSISSVFGKTYFSFDYFGINDFSSLNTFITSYFIDKDKRTYQLYRKTNWQAVFTWVESLSSISTNEGKVRSEVYLKVIEHFENIGLAQVKGVSIDNNVIELTWNDRMSVLISNRQASLFIDVKGVEGESGYYIHLSFDDLNSIYIPEEFVQLINESSL